ncbi:MAG: 1-deoxy-D-xylulose-5-phosphate reductoisomerase [Phycisphaerae bacterium]
MRRRLAILGSTGSIGESAIDVAEGLRDQFEIVGLGAGRRWEKLAAQVNAWHPAVAALSDPDAAANLQRVCTNGTRVFAGADALCDLVRESRPDFVLSAVVGAAGLPATITAVEQCRSVGLANKESLVVAGSILMPLAKKTGCSLVPVDSEHSAIFQALQSGRGNEVSKIYLTGSGGPFREWSADRIQNATLDEALRHPTWQMGPKITIDSATLANKALEIIEACWLFDLPPEKVEVLIHPESIVHSMVEFCDGSVIAQLGTPDMRTPIQYAMTYPHRAPNRAPTLKWSDIKTLRFEQPDAKRFPALRLGYEAAAAGGNAGAVFNAANEIAVDAFRAGRIGFGRIPEFIEAALKDTTHNATPSLDDLLNTDREVRTKVTEWTRS